MRASDYLSGHQHVATLGVQPSATHPKVASLDACLNAGRLQAALCSISILHSLYRILQQPLKPQ
jgi:hypothetical protein